MKMHDNTLYITTQGAYISKDGENLSIRLNDETRRQFPVHTLGGLVCFGNVSLSPFALGLCGQSGVTVSMLTEQGRFLARMEGPISGNVLLRRAQYRASESAQACTKVAKAFIIAKVANARTVLLRAERDQSEPAPAISLAAERLAATLGTLPAIDDLDTLRGAEGEAAVSYFDAFDHLITSQKADFRFQGRSRRPPRDSVNAMLSFLSVILTHDARAACETVGLDPQVGFLHRNRPGRPSLALDLMEEFRPVLVDRLVFSLINRKQVEPGGFRLTESGGVEMDDKTRKTLLAAWQTRKADELTHPFLDEKITVGMLPHIQARLLARHLRGDLDAYPAFFWR